jgi:hypothetical protein
MLEATIVGRDNECQTNVPRHSDVLYGRDKSIQEHSGNIRYLNLIAKFWDRYEGAKKIEKKSITEEMLEVVKASGGRFLKMDDSGWVEVSDVVARGKVSNAFRDRRKAVNRVQARTLKSQCGTRKRDVPFRDCSSQHKVEAVREAAQLPITKKHDDKLLLLAAAGGVQGKTTVPHSKDDSSTYVEPDGVVPKRLRCVPSP